MHRTRLLRSALLGNAAFSTLSGLAMLVAGAPLAAWLGLASAVPLYFIGPGLLLFAADLVHQATREHLSARRAFGASLGDAAWVAGSAVLLLGWPELLSPAGRLAVVGVAALVAFFAALQLLGLRRLALHTSDRDAAPLREAG